MAGALAGLQSLPLSWQVRQRAARTGIRGRFPWGTWLLWGMGAVLLVAATWLSGEWQHFINPRLSKLGAEHNK